MLMNTIGDLLLVTFRSRARPAGPPGRPEFRLDPCRSGRSVAVAIVTTPTDR